MAAQIFDEEGNFTGAEIIVMGSQVWDAGTELNDEVPADTAFLAQAMPDTGSGEGDTVQLHAGFIPAGNILNSYPGANFTAEGFEVLRITVTEAPPNPINVKVELENLAPDGGNFLTPVWVAFHDGSFDIFDEGGMASAGLESIAEDGATGTLGAEFEASGAGSRHATVISGGDIPPFAPGDSNAMTFRLDGASPLSRYLSFASLVIPSNDGFVANGDPMAMEIFDEAGNFVGAEIIIVGSQVWDAGTEVNDEVPANTAFLEQAAPDTGDDEGGTVQLHEGFMPEGNVLSAYPAADFMAAGFEVLRITVTEVPPNPINVKVELENLAPDEGNFLTPAWVAFHDGSFDIFDEGGMASAGLESIAEDGATGTLGAEFEASCAGSKHATVISGGDIPPFAPGDSNAMTFTLDGASPLSRYLSFASMVIPSNDAFVANGDPMAMEIFDEAGNFVGGEIIIVGSQVWDAGTEVNDEVPANTAFLEQAAPDTGDDEAGTVQAHEGFMAGGDVLTAYPAADFLAEGFEVLRITVTEVPPNPINVKVELENLAPDEGNFLTPVWVAFHDGSFDIFDEGGIASAGLESIAEDSATGTLGTEFEASGAGSTYATVISGGDIPPFAPGDSNAMTFTLDGASPLSRYLSFASMVIPSNDAFVANGDPMAMEIFDEAGNFVGAEIIIVGSQVWDAATEVNDEVPANTAFLEQAMPNTGDDEGGTVRLHEGFMAAGNILNAYPDADFLAGGYQVLRITVTEVLPNPMNLKVELENLAPDEGNFLTPVWLAFHDGSFDIFDEGGTASAGLESLAEDGATGTLGAEFEVARRGSMHATVTSGGDIPPFAPGASSAATFSLDAASPLNRYLSFASMVIPSNDAFVANGDPMAMEIFDGAGNFVGAEIIIVGSQVWDAATEVNDEVPANTAFLEQAMPNTGDDEEGTVQLHEGFMAAGNILNAYPDADFLAGGYQVLRITVTEVPPNPVDVTVEVENLAPESGNFLTPVWLAFHDGSFDIFDQGGTASAGLESLAEDGATGTLGTEFESSRTGSAHATLTSGGEIPPFAPGASNAMTITLDGASPLSRFLSFATMVIPSNDAFVANGDPMAMEIFDADGNFTGAEVIIQGSQVWDAGTEVNDEVPANTAFLEQAMPNTGEDEAGTIQLHAGFMSGGTILGAYPAADFLADGYQVLRITITEEVFNPWPDLGNFPGSEFKFSPWFGLFYDFWFPFVYHETHGWFYVSADENTGDIYLYNYTDDLGWLYTTEELYPFLYSFSLAAWLQYSEGSSNPRSFFNFDPAVNGSITIP